MIRAIAKHSEAEREHLAKVINAKGEFKASAYLLEAAEILGKDPLGIQLRYLQTMSDIAGDRTNTIVFAFPQKKQLF